MSELVTNAVLHGRGCRGVTVAALEDGLRIEVRDQSKVPPVLGHASDASLTGRGIHVVRSLAARWGVDAEPEGKVIWVDVDGELPQVDVGHLTEGDLLDMWDDSAEADGEVRFRVELGDVPTDLLLAAKSHVDNIVREFALAAADDDVGVTGDAPSHLATLLVAVERFADARLAIKHHALSAARAGAPSTHLVLDLPVGGADAAEAYLAALDEIDSYCRAGRFLTLESPPQHRVFRHWYIGELAGQLRAAAAGGTAPRPEPFEQRLLAELDQVAAAQRASDRAARLYAVVSALAAAATPEAVADAVLVEGAAALRASGGGVLLATDADRLALSGAIGYDEAILEQLRSESPDADLPAASALRTGEAVWLESRDERDRRFPALAGVEAATVSLCAVPLEVPGRRLGAMRFSFTEPRLFDEDERRFVLALASQAAQALDRAQLQLARVDVSRRLQRGLLPPSLPPVRGLDVAGIYKPFGDGIDVGGDFYDLWVVDDGRWGLAIGDASGTGPEAAAFTALARHTLRALALTEPDPAVVLQRLNSLLLAASDGTDRFCTAIFGFISVNGSVELHLASGGHPPVLVRRGGVEVEAITVGGQLLGLLDDAAVRSVRIALQPGDAAVLITDGVLEARRDQKAFFDTSGVERVLRAAPLDAASIAAALEDSVRSFVGGTLNDDMAALVLAVPA